MSLKELHGLKASKNDQIKQDGECFLVSLYVEMRQKMLGRINMI